MARRWWRVGAALVVTVVLISGGVVARALLVHNPAAVVVPVCQATAGTATYPLDLDQAANAGTIAAVGKRLGMADHAVTIALAAALQESELRNLSHGDRDSLGLFQQRPSQGWGTASQIMLPRYAATAFYQHLGAIAGWETLAVTDAAQRVQRSAAPDAYAQWEAEARVLAQALTGEVPAGLSCTFPTSSYASTPGPWATALAGDLGPVNIADPVAVNRGWTIATWLVGHAAAYRITAVSFAGNRWTPVGAWLPDPSAGASQVVQVRTVPPGKG
ncbi:MAG: hypothetical protein M3N98_00965 [Actinomycetota bacterium]|nr:hypothetical protein [Actinomycetota bacterium]